MRVIFLVLFMAVCGTTFSQSYVISPSKTIIVSATANQLTIFDIYQRNISGNPLNLGWKRISLTIPSGWDYSLCDYGTCYPGLPDTGAMATVAIADSGFLGLNINPYSFSGTATASIYVYDKTAPSSGDTLTWIVHAGNVGISGIYKAAVCLYPNPAASYIKIDYPGEIDEVKIVGVKGDIMTIQNPGNLIQIDECLKSGMYFVSGYRNKIVLFNQRIVVNH